MSEIHHGSSRCTHQCGGTSFPPFTLLEQPKAPEYFSFYMPENTVVIAKDMKFKALAEERRKEVLEDNFDNK